MDEILKKELANLVRDRQRANIDRQTWFASKARLERTVKRLTKAWFEVKEAPENIVIKIKDDIYLIQIDTEGDHCHNITPVDQVVGL